MNQLINDPIAAQFDSPAYQLIDKIGEGGFGHVYKATLVNTGQPVAIKFLSISSEFDANKRQRYIERFERETLLGSRLQHPNIVRLLDKGESGQLLFAVFEYVEGKTLKQHLTESGALSANQTTDVMTQVLDALAHAHQQGVVHRDIKPANIMLSESAAKLHVKVLDFGIGTLVNEARVQDYKSITLTQETLGTPSYSSPEQLRGEPATIKTDLYVWGLVFIECLTGKPAMSGSNLASIFHKQLSQENVALPSAIVGHPLAALLRRVLQKKAHLRSVNAPDLYHEIQQINVANLVGDMQTNKSSVSIAMDNDTTLITNSSALNNTGHTERKQLTVMAVRLNVNVIQDKEIDHEVIDTLHRDQKNQCLDTAIRYGAFHVGTLGDTLLFYYGYPAASDNDARLCARTALDLISDLNKRNALLKINQGIELDIKIGIHTGLLTCYADATPEGDSANIALQLVRLAGREQILCSHTTQKILQSYIEFNPLTQQPLGVSSTSTALFNLMAERQVEAFGFLRTAQNNHRFIGREQEIDRLLNMQKQSNVNKLTHLFGEAGIGKSRLIFEYRNQSAQYTHFIGQCLPEHINDALYPILNILKFKYALNSLSAVDAIATLSAEISLFEEINLEDILPILAAWLGYPLSEEMAPSVLSPDLQKQLLFKTLTALLNKRDNLHANLFVFEDMHWADPTSLEFIHSLSSSEPFNNSNNLFISTSRLPLPEMFDSEIYQSVELHKLTEQDSKNFINTLFDNQNVSVKVIDAVVSRTDGIPLFIEELVDMLKQKVLVQHINGITDFINSEKLEQLPTTLRDSLQQKLDSLVYSKETAQLASTIGREFDYDLLVATSNHSEAQLQTDLEELVSADVILQQRRVSGDSYIFKHALLRDVAYEGMNIVNKQKNHLSIAKCLEQSQNKHKTPENDIISYHFLNCQVLDKCVQYGISHAQFLASTNFSKHSELYIRSIISINSDIDNESTSLSNELLLNQLIVPVLMSYEGYGSQSISELLSRNESITSRLIELGDDSSTDIFVNHSRQWGEAQILHMRSDRIGAMSVAKKLVSDARLTNCHRRLVDGLSLQGLCLTTDGYLVEAEQAFLESISIYKQDEHFEISSVNGTDPMCHAAINLALTLALLGKFEESQHYIDMGMAHSKQLKHGLSEALCHCYQMYILALNNDKQSVTFQAKIQENYFSENPDFSFLFSYSRAIIDWAKGKTDFQEEFSKLRVESDQTYLHSFYDALLALTHKNNGNQETANLMLTETLNWCEQSGEKAFINFITENINVN